MRKSAKKKSSQYGYKLYGLAQNGGTVMLIHNNSKLYISGAIICSGKSGESDRRNYEKDNAKFCTEHCPYPGKPCRGTCKAVRG